MPHRPHPILYAVLALVAVSVAVANVVLAFPAAPSEEAAFEPRVPPVTSPETVPDVPETPGLGDEPRPEPSDVPMAETLTAPISRAAERVTKKPFGIEIHPSTSPVPNDRFDGFHVGVDFETTEEEQGIDVPVYVACPGPLLFRQHARGYGGVAVQRCRLDGQEVTVIYGHLRLTSIQAKPGQMLRPGEEIGVLGTGHGPETDGVRKHLHFGLHASATATDIRGYVKTRAETEGWLDALEYVAP